jgi:hypothetical protein
LGFQAQKTSTPIKGKEPEKKKEESKEKQHQPQAQTMSLQSPPMSSSWFGGGMFNSVKTMTSSALKNIQTGLDSLVGPQDMEMNIAEEKPPPRVTTEEETSLSAALAVSSLLSDNEVRMELSPDSSDHSRRLSQDTRSSQSPPVLTLRETPDSSPEKAKQSQSLRTLEMKKENIERRISSTSGQRGLYDDCQNEQVLLCVLLGWTMSLITKEDSVVFWDVYFCFCNTCM